MAGRNGMGPTESGPMTGRGMGYCKHENNAMTMERPGYNRLHHGRSNSCGYGRGKGFAFRRGENREFYSDEESYLKERQFFLENELNQVKAKLDNYKTDSE